MARIVFTIVFLALSVVPVFSQITCVPFGTLSHCSGPGIDQTQVPLGPNTGVIITDQATTPYTIIQPGRARAFDPKPLPTMPRPSTFNSPASPYGYGQNPIIMPPDPGLGNGLGALGGGMLGE